MPTTLIRAALGRELRRQAEAGKIPGVTKAVISLISAPSNVRTSMRQACTAGVRVQVVVGDRHLPVRPGGNGARFGAELVRGLREAGDRLAAPPPARPGRHREDRVLGQERAQRLDVASRPRVHVAIDGLAGLLVAEQPQGRLLAPLGKAVVDCLASPLEGAVHRGNRGLQRLRHLEARRIRAPRGG